MSTVSYVQDLLDSYRHLSNVHCVIYTVSPESTCDDVQLYGNITFAEFKDILHSIDPQDKSTWAGESTSTRSIECEYDHGIIYTFQRGRDMVGTRRVVLSSLILGVPGHDVRVHIHFVQYIPFIIQEVIQKTPPKVVYLFERILLRHALYEYKFEKIASGATKELATMSPPIFSISIHLQIGDDTMRNTNHTARSIVCKGIDLIGRYSSTYDLTIPFEEMGYIQK